MQENSENKKNRVFLPRETIEDILSRSSKDGARYNLEGIWIDCDKKRVYATDGHRLASRLWYPDRATMPAFEQVIPSDQPICQAHLTLGKKASGNVLKALKRFQKDEIVKVEFKKDKVVFSTQSEGNTVSVDYACGVEGRTETIKREVTEGKKHDVFVPSVFGVRCEYLVEALTKLQDKGNKDGFTVEMEYHGNLSPICIRLADLLEVVMPVRLD